jgi:enamine deaminase RidA (YjgF/YER057c/UK114 family)
MLFTTTGPGDLDFLTWTPDEIVDELRSPARSAYRELFAEVETRGSEILQERIFGVVEAAGDILAGRAEAASENPGAGLPPTFVEGTPCNRGLFAGIQLITARPADQGATKSIEHNGTICGRQINGADACYLGLSDVGRLADRRDRTPVGDARDTIDLARELLVANGWSFHQVRRTWFYLDDILSWYDDFNRARNEVFVELGLLNGSRPGLIPASTGINGRNLRGHRCTLDLLAIRPQDEQRVEFNLLHNPLQNEAPEYGSAFSRGLTVATASCRYLFVSGTASIDETGATIHSGDFERQTRRTLDNIESLLASRGAVMSDICQATVFIKHREDLERLTPILRARGLDGLPAVCTVDDVCRDDLLVEIDATAMMPHRFGDVD